MIQVQYPTYPNHSSDFLESKGQTWVSTDLALFS